MLQRVLEWGNSALRTRPAYAQQILGLSHFKGTSSKVRIGIVTMVGSPKAGVGSHAIEQCLCRWLDVEE
jgi:hypothetical protein